MRKHRTGVCLLALLAVAAIPAPVAAATCSAQSSWFSSPSLPSDVTTTDCGFQQFSWQSFAALVLGQVNSNPLFESYMQSQGVFVSSTSTPVSYGSQPSVPSDCSGSGATLLLTQIDNTDADSSVLEAQDVQPLVDQNGNWVHYGIHMNETVYNYLVYCNLWQGGCFNSAGSNILFPASTSLGNSIVIKTAWKVMTSSDNSANYITTTAAVSPTGPTNSGCTTVTVGLVGMHIATKTPTQAEWIWSTFEHRNNDPLCSEVSSSPQPPLGGSWSFYKLNCSGDYCTTNTYFNPCSGNTSLCPDTSGANEFCSACTTAGIPTQVCLVNEAGGDDEGNIQALNTSVWSLTSSVLDNYELIGTEWTSDGTATGTITGSTSLANSVAETYVQTTDSCFSCHRSTFKSYPPASATATAAADFSHLFDAIDSSTTNYCSTPSPPSGYTCPSVTSTASTGSARSTPAPMASHKKRP
jgi:hypothetical protein